MGAAMRRSEKALDDFGGFLLHMEHVADEMLNDYVNELITQSFESFMAGESATRSREFRNFMDSAFAYEMGRRPGRHDAQGCG